MATGERTPKLLRLVGPHDPVLTISVNRALAVAAEVIVAIGPMRRLLTPVIPTDERLVILEDLGLGNGAALVSAACAAKFDQTLVINADTINDVSYSAFIDLHLARGTGASILLSRWRNAQNAGAYAVRPDGLVIHSFEDGSASTFHVPLNTWRGASTGVLLFPTRDLRSISVIGTDVVERAITPAFITRQLLWASDAGTSMTLDLGTPDRIAQSQDLPRSAYLRRD